MLLVFDRVTKFYGPVIGVNNISCRIGPGITGLFGANGAGKSTMMKLASGQLRPSQGEVRVGEDRAWSSAAKRNLGFSPDINSFYEEMTGREFVYVMARLCGHTRRDARRLTEIALEEVDMVDRGDRRIGGCSHGMRQRIKLAQALVNDPPVLLLDEPMTGIDPGGRRDIGRLLVRMAERGKTILVSSHILNEVESLTDSILMIAAGRIVASGTLSEVRNLLDDQPFTVEITTDRAREMAARLIGIPEVLSVELRGESLIVRTLSPGSFFGRCADLVLSEQFVVHRLQTLDTGADAVFGYLQQGSA
ncbi:MAG: ABC transporter ATP-binding protein [Planctomycetaceae bacterium]|nr:ABC transporter ATP-binding protein [Planctomycetaceae bacterium]